MTRSAFVGQMHGRARAVQARDARVILGLVEEGLRQQRRQNQRANAIAELEHCRAGPRPLGAAAHDDDGLLGAGHHIGGLFQRFGVRVHGPAREERRGRLVRFIVVLELLLLDVHRAAQHDGAVLGLRQIECLAHDIVRLVGRHEADETGFAGGGKARLVQILGVLLVRAGSFAAKSDQRRVCTAGGHQRGGELRDARAAGCSGNARGVRGPRIAVRHPEPCAFVAHLVYLDAEPVERVDPVHVAVAHHAERRCCAFRLERMGQSFINLHLCCSSLLG